MADRIPETLFEQINRRAADARDRQRLVAVKAALGLSDRDELWPLIMTLDHYSRATVAAHGEIQRAIQEIPKIIGRASSEAGTIAKSAADTAVAHAVNRAAKHIAETSVEQITAQTDRLFRPHFIIAMALGAVTAVAILAAGFTAAYFVFAAKGICAEPAFVLDDGARACFLDLPSG